MSSAAPTQYLITLCTATQQLGLDEYFGVAVRFGSSDSKFKAPTTKVIHSILTFSPAPDSVAVEFLNELSKVTNMGSLGKWSLYFPVGIFWNKNGNSQASFALGISSWLRDLGQAGYGFSPLNSQRTSALWNLNQLPIPLAICYPIFLSLVCHYIYSFICTWCSLP